MLREVSNGFVMGKGIQGMKKCIINDINLEGTPFVAFEVEGKTMVEEIAEVVKGKTACSTGKFIFGTKNGLHVIVDSLLVEKNTINSITIVFHIAPEQAKAFER